MGWLLGIVTLTAAAANQYGSICLCETGVDIRCQLS